MSDIKQELVKYLTKHPEITKAKQKGVLNERGLARRLVDENIVSDDEFTAALGVIRRFNWQTIQAPTPALKTVSYSIQSDRTVLTYEKKTISPQSPTRHLTRNRVATRRHHQNRHRIKHRHSCHQ